MNSRIYWLMFVGAVVVSFAAHAQELSWKHLGSKDDYTIEWASNLAERDGKTVMTMYRQVYAREDRAPNNARFNNERVGVQINCEAKTYQAMGVTYNMGNRTVYSQSFAGTNGGWQPVARTFLEPVANSLCG